MTRFYLVLGAVAVVGVAALLYTIGSTALSSAAAEPVPLDIPDDATLVSLAKGIERGDPSAPVTIVEFGDFQCPACGTFAQSFKPLVDVTFVESGRAKFLYFDFPLVQVHPNAFLAARAGRCANDQERFWDYHDQLFAYQGRWFASGNPLGQFIDYAEELGLDGGAFSTCLRSDKHADVISANMQLGEQLGVAGTPTIMVRSGQGMMQRLPDFSWETIEKAVMEAEGLAADRGE